MKKWICMALSCAFVLAVSGCGRSENQKMTEENARGSVWNEKILAESGGSD